MTHFEWWTEPASGHGVTELLHLVQWGGMVGDGLVDKETGRFTLRVSKELGNTQWEAFSDGEHLFTRRPSEQWTERQLPRPSADPHELVLVNPLDLLRKYPGAAQLIETGLDIVRGVEARRYRVADQGAAGRVHIWLDDVNRLVRCHSEPSDLDISVDLPVEGSFLFKVPMEFTAEFWDYDVPFDMPPPT